MVNVDVHTESSGHIVMVSGTVHGACAPIVAFLCRYEDSVVPCVLIEAIKERARQLCRVSNRGYLYRSAASRSSSDKSS